MDRLDVLELAREIADDNAVVEVEDDAAALAVREEAERMGRVRAVPPEEEGEAWTVGPKFRI